MKLDEEFLERDMEILKNGSVWEQNGEIYCKTCGELFLSERCKKEHQLFCIRCKDSTTWTKGLEDYDIAKYCQEFIGLDICGTCFQKMMLHFREIALKFIRDNVDSNYPGYFNVKV